MVKQTFGKWIFLFLTTLIFFNCNKKKQFIHVLVFSKTAEFRHESIETGIAAIRALSKEHGFTMFATEDASIFKQDELRKYNVVLFLSTTGNILNDEQQQAFEQWIQAGGGFVGIHAATDTEYEWAWYNQLVGGYFANHPAIQEATIDVLDHSHPSTQHLPKKWTRTGEWYNFKQLIPETKKLLNLDESTYEGGTMGDNHPLAWYREFDGGRTWYTAIGHTKESFAEPLFLEHIWGGIQYAAGDRSAVDYVKYTAVPNQGSEKWSNLIFKKFNLVGE